MLNSIYILFLTGIIIVALVFWHLNRVHKIVIAFVTNDSGIKKKVDINDLKKNDLKQEIFDLMDEKWDALGKKENRRQELKEAIGGKFKKYSQSLGQIELFVNGKKVDVKENPLTYKVYRDGRHEILVKYWDGRIDTAHISDIQNVKYIEFEVGQQLSKSDSIAN